MKKGGVVSDGSPAKRSRITATQKRIGLQSPATVPSGRPGRGCPAIPGLGGGAAAAIGGLTLGGAAKDWEFPDIGEDLSFAPAKTWEEAMEESDKKTKKKKVKNPPQQQPQQQPPQQPQPQQQQQQQQDLQPLRAFNMGGTHYVPKAFQPAVIGGASPPGNMHDNSEHMSSTHTVVTNSTGGSGNMHYNSEHMSSSHTVVTNSTGGSSNSRSSGMTSALTGMSYQQELQAPIKNAHAKQQPHQIPDHAAPPQQQQQLVPGQPQPANPMQHPHPTPNQVVQQQQQQAPGQQLTRVQGQTVNIPAAAATMPSSSAMLSHNAAPKAALYTYYGKKPRRKQLNNDDYICWSNQGRPHELKFTAVFVCPISGEVFPSGRAGDPRFYVAEVDPNPYGFGAETIWYTKKVLAEHGAAARCLDCLVFREAMQGPGGAEAALKLERVAAEPPYLASEAPHLPPIPPTTKEQIQENLQRMQGPMLPQV